MSRNPSWAYDELILALDLYLRNGALDDRDQRVIELSELLNALPIHTARPDAERFRNPNGVALKLANFAAQDPAYPGVGMTRGGKRDAEVWQEFSHRRADLHRIADELRSGAVNHSFPTTPEDGDEENGFIEGRLLYRRHRTRERDPRLVKRKKEQVLERTGRLTCEVCGFDFAERYGTIGDGYIECHHTRPLADTGHTTTRLSDLALLCANCHRMAHRPSGILSLDQLRATLQP
jgi:5-methylcytosine-specific restriction protein A